MPFASFPIFYILPWNPVYAGIAAMVLGAIAAVLCRPDLNSKTLLGGVLFLVLYSIFLLGLKWSAPGYIEQVWNLKSLSGIEIYGLPIEELMFGFSFGLVWTGIYEHFTWKRSVTELPPPGSRHRTDEVRMNAGPVTGVLNLRSIRET